MPDTFLQRLLNEGHLRDLGEDETRFDALTKAVQDLSADLATDGGRGQAIPFTIVALDEAAPLADPVFERLASAIIAHWSTYGNVYKGDPPRQLLRMVALAAVQDAAESDDRVAAAAWYAAANRLAVSPTGQEVVRAFAEDMGGRTESTATDLWKRPGGEPSFRMPPRAKAEAGSIEGFVLAKGLIADEVLKALTTATTVVQVRDLNTNQNDAFNKWAAAVAPEVAAVVQSAVDSGTRALVKRINEAGFLSVEGIKDFAEDTGGRVREALAEAQQAWAGRDLRSDLLWWRQSLYSPSLQGSYRDLDSRRAAIAMAVDLHTLIPDFAPQSVEFVLREAVRACELDETLTLAEFLGEVRAHRDVWEDFYQAEAPAGVRRAPALTAALVDEGNPSEWLGPVASEPLPIAEVAVWAFRELQAARLVSHA